MITQKERIIQYIKDFGSITSLDGFKDLGISRVPNRIMELRREGWVIYSRIEKSRNRYGDIIHYNRYALDPFTDYHEELEWDRSYDDDPKLFGGCGVNLKFDNEVCDGI